MERTGIPQRCIDSGDAKTTKSCETCGVVVCLACKYHFGGGMFPDESDQGFGFSDDVPFGEGLTRQDKEDFEHLQMILKQGPQMHVIKDAQTGAFSEEADLGDIDQIRHFAWCAGPYALKKAKLQRQGYEFLLPFWSADSLWRFNHEPEKFEVLRFKALCATCDAEELRGYDQRLASNRVCHCRLRDGLSLNRWLCDDCGHTELMELNELSAQVYGDGFGRVNADSGIRAMERLTKDCVYTEGKGHTIVKVCTWCKRREGRFNWVCPRTRGLDRTHVDALVWETVQQSLPVRIAALL
ncbi:Hypothetical protein D9617_21g097080 [Elsinoe fawcettii]|nr:Hypothetical protein D9617_21g097080 [Elsinoe fawcettii]